MKLKFYLLFLIIMTMSCRNIYDDVADKDSQKAIYYEAKLQLNEKNYDSAIALLQSLGPTFLGRRDVQVIYASAYSGRCGLDLISLASNLENLATANNIFDFLFANYVGATDSKIGDCLASESILANIGDYTVRTPNENILMGLSSLVKIGTVLNARADLDDDGVVDGTFDHCDLAQLSDDDVAEIGTGMSNAILSAAASGSDINPDLLTEISNLCASYPSVGVFCNTTDKTAFTALELAAFRAVIGSSTEGIGACAGDPTVCFCP